ncbi:hypothetical protein CUU66_22595 [Peribacillus deserti]|uniref:Uncharacterized protein n=1 Tax=Peribacillus deserti TaxID=673318 RepID=A0A2N5M071_9BACI|nr:hypothetical protein CUU66_22595 [Peribacillus deserti]
MYGSTSFTFNKNLFQKAFFPVLGRQIAKKVTRMGFIRNKYWFYDKKWTTIPPAMLQPGGIRKFKWQWNT